MPASFDPGRLTMPPPALTHILQTALAHQRAGRAAEAEKCCARARAAAPQSFDAYHISGYLALQQRRFESAVALLSRAAQLNPRSAPCLLRLGKALRLSGRIAEARGAVEGAIAIEPGLADAHFLFGELVAARDGMRAAVPHFRRVTELQPDAADAWANLGVALAQTGGVEEALRCFEQALAGDAGNAQALTGRALALQTLHRPAEAIAAYDDVLRRHPDHHEARSARLLALHYVDDCDRAQLLAEHVDFGSRLPEKPASGLTNDCSTDRRLRVAFLSPDLRAHSVAYFLEPLLANLDPSEFEILLYHDHARVDAMSARLRGRARVWREFAGQSDAAVAAAIRADAPDLLIDLAGHTGFNRLPLLARRLAPVQITYLGYPDTTGVPAMDFRFVDAITDPEGDADALATETLVRFAPTAWAYAPPLDAPAVAPAPCVRSGAITFGCFNNFAKVSGETLRMWSAILDATPGSRLLLKSHGLDSAVAQGELHARFANAKIDPARVELLGRTEGLAAHLALYGRVDIALDTFPYHGTTTTCEALWMGVPVVTRVGDRHMSRVGASLLTAISRPEWIAADAADYTRIAVVLASAPGRLGEIRGGLRTQMQGSALLDHAAQGARFGSALRDCWRAWCERRSATDGADAVSANPCAVRAD